MSATSAHPHPTPPAASPAYRTGLPTEASSGAASPARNSAPFDVLVVGAGEAALSMAWHLAGRGVRYLVIDSAPEIGHSWRTRWDSLRLFTSGRYDGLLGR